MDQLNEFIQYIGLDEKKRILVRVQEQLEVLLKEKKARAYLLKSIKKILSNDFKSFEVGKSMVRITVQEGTEEKNLEKVHLELLKGLKMALPFLPLLEKNKNSSKVASTRKP